jgi:integrase/recombinase XerD
MTTSTTLLRFQPDAMTPAQFAAVSYLARYSGHTHSLYAYQLRRWFGWCEAGGLDAWSGCSGRTWSSTSGSYGSAG